MNSKIVKWFIRQTGIRKPDENKSKKSSLLKERSETLRKFSLGRLSLRKRHKQRVSPKSIEEESPDSSKSEALNSSKSETILSISSSSTLQMAPTIDPDNEQESDIAHIEHINSTVLEKSIIDSIGKEVSVKQPDGDICIHQIDKVVADASYRMSSSPPPEELLSNENAPRVNAVIDSPDNSDLEESSSDSASTIKRVDTLEEEDSLVDCTNILPEQTEDANCSSDIIENSITEELPNDITNYSGIFKKEDMKERVNSTDIIDQNSKIKLSFSNSSIDIENTPVINGHNSNLDDNENNKFVHNYYQPNLTQIQIDEVAPDECELNDIQNAQKCHKGPIIIDVPNDSHSAVSVKDSDNPQNATCSEVISAQNGNIFSKDYPEERLQHNEKEFDDLSDQKKTINSSSESLSKSNEKSATATDSQAPVQNTSTSMRPEEYPESLNPFGDDTGDDTEVERNTQKKPMLKRSDEMPGNPFGSDSDEDREIEKIQSRRRDTSGTNNEIPYRKKESIDNSRNPFRIYEAVENQRLSLSNPFAEDLDDRSKADTPPTLPPKLEYRLRQGSLVSLSRTPVPHPRKSKQYHLHGSSSSLNSAAFPPVPYPRSFVPSTSSETLNSMQDCEEGSNFARGNTRSSLPVSSQIRFSKKKRTAPRPPNQVPPHRSASSDRDSLRGTESFQINDGPSGFGTPSSRTNQPPPRPPPPKIQLRDHKSNIKEKFLRIM